MSDPLADAAKELGRQRGVRRASFMFLSDAKEMIAKHIIEGYPDSDPDVMSFCPDPLSAEWSDDPTPIQVLEEIADAAECDEDISDDDDLLDLYEEAYRKAFWDDVLEKARKLVKS